MREHSLGVARRLQRVAQRSCKIASLREVVGEVLRVIVGFARLVFAAGVSAMNLLQRLADVLVQSSASNGIEFFIQDFADLVMGEREAIVVSRPGTRSVLAGSNQLRRTRLIQRVQQLVLARRGNSRQFPEREDLAQGCRGS